MEIVEMKGKIAEDGSIILPPGVLETMGVSFGDAVSLYCLINHSGQAENTFFLCGDEMENSSGVIEIEAAEQPEISLPHALLEVAGLPLDGDLDIQCVSGAIVIGSADLLSVVPPSLMGLFDDLGISHAAIRKVLTAGGRNQDVRMSDSERGKI